MLPKYHAVVHEESEAGRCEGQMPCTTIALLTVSVRKCVSKEATRLWVRAFGRKRHW